MCAHAHAHMCACVCACVYISVMFEISHVMYTVHSFTHSWLLRTLYDHTVLCTVQEFCLTM